MHFTRLTLLAAISTGVAASSAPDMLNEIRARFHGADTVLLPRQSSTNLQTFSGALGGITAEPVTKTDDSKRPFAVAGDTFTDFADAAGRSCDNQMNSCASMANSGGQSFTVSDCNEQNTQCKADITNEEVAVSSGTSLSTSTTTTSSSTSTTSTSTSSSSTSTSTTAVAAAPAAATTSAVTTTATTSASLALVSSNAEFNFFCEV